MSILKNKILMARKLKQEKSSETQSISTEDQHPSTDVPNSPNASSITENSPNAKKRRRILGAPITPENVRCTKNIAKNYGRAIIAFASSKIAKPYLTPILTKAKTDQKEFLRFLTTIKPRITGIDSFRNVLVINSADSEAAAKYKRAFIEISQIFIKYFSVNWIFSSKKLAHKRTYLEFRFKMLRRIVNPESFTYIKG